MITIAPVGDKRVLATERYQPILRSCITGDSASCLSFTGSSMINTSALRPVVPPPIPTAVYSPPLSVSQRPAALESSERDTLKRFLYSGEATILRAFLPKFTAKSALYEE